MLLGRVIILLRCVKKSTVMNASFLKEEILVDYKQSNGSKQSMQSQRLKLIGTKCLLIHLFLSKQA